MNRADDDLIPKSENVRVMAAVITLLNDSSLAKFLLLEDQNLITTEQCKTF